MRERLTVRVPSSPSEASVDGLRQHWAMPDARYDGAADWYDELAGDFVQPFASVLAARAADFVGPGSVVLDIGCGTGLHFRSLQTRGLQPIGVDVSADQLRIAHERAVVVQADAAALPIGDGTIALAVAAFVHTDIDRFSSAVAEVARVLRSGGQFVYVGIHPCFTGTFVSRTTERDARELMVGSGYGDPRVVFGGSGSSGLSSRVGFRNLTLSAFLNAFLGSGLRIQSFEELDTQARPWLPEPGDRTIVPWNVLVVAARS
jgi:SAM-dependent methyltransferase